MGVEPHWGWGPCDRGTPCDCCSPHSQPSLWNRCSHKTNAQVYHTQNKSWQLRNKQNASLPHPEKNVCQSRNKWQDKSSLPHPKQITAFTQQCQLTASSTNWCSHTTNNIHGFDTLSKSLQLHYKQHTCFNLNCVCVFPPNPKERQQWTTLTLSASFDTVLHECWRGFHWTHFKDHPVINLLLA